MNPLKTHQSGASPLPYLGVIRAQGADAAAFLHGQLSNDVLLLGPAQARLALYCSAKGRMLASFIVCKRAADDIVLVCSRDLLPVTLQRLKSFVLRAKVSLSNASDDFALWGLAGAALPTVFDLAPSELSALLTWDRRESGAASLIVLPPALGQARALWLAPTGTLPALTATLPLEQWRWGEVQSGIAWISQPLVDVLVPQMLNFESVGGVNFKKGCYPGQEVVARSQFRGTLKRRGYLCHCQSPMIAGQDVFTAEEAEQPCGIVAQAAAALDGGFDAIVSLQTAAAQAGRLHLGGSDGPALQILPLPYPLLADI